MVAVLQPLHNHGMKVFFHLNDLIMMAKSQELAMFHMSQLILHLTKLGFAISWKKNRFLPHQRMEYLGAALDALSLWAALSEHR